MIIKWIIKYIQDFFNKNYNKIKRIIILEGGNGPFRKDINPIWDWGSHPLAFILKLLQKDLLIKYVCNEIKNNNSKNKGLICRFNLYFSSGINVKIITGNLFNKKIRKLKILLEDSKFFEYNIIANSILINNKVIDLNLKKDQTIQSLLNQFYLNIKNGYQNKQFENLKISTQSIRILENFYKC